jgi:hypothetical protein
VGVPSDASAAEVSGDNVEGSAFDRIIRQLGPRPQYWLARFWMLRLLGLVYLCAFLVLVNQAVPLIGREGLLPAGSFMDRVAENLGSRWDGFERLPSLFWIGVSDRALVILAWVGVALSVFVLAGFANSIVMGALWALYISFVHIGQLWYGYGWEILLLETGFLAIFLCPLLDPRPFPKSPPPELVIWLYRWLIFRVMFGAGLIKMRGDPCWRDLTCLYYHYETQPIPNPISPFLHFMPHWFHNVGVLYNHLAELFAPFFALGPRVARHLAGVAMLVFQVFLIFSGNLSFLNWLTIVAILACFDDSLLARLAPEAMWRRVQRAAEVAHASLTSRITVGILVALVALLSYFPVRNMLSPEQSMNASFDSLALVNTYGAFGSVGKERDEIVFEGTRDPTISPNTKWTEYEFKCKPGDPMRRPCWMSPYHYRIDWQIWFAAMTSPRHAPWTLHFVWKLLHNDPGALSLIAGNPFPAAPPKYIRAELYRYQFAPLGKRAWWNRTPEGEWLKPLSVDDPALREFLEAYGWLPRSSAAPLDATDDDG